MAVVLEDAQITPELMAFLLVQNASKMIFGAFGIYLDSRRVLLEHSIIGSTCDRNELAISMTSVAETADRYDDAIIEKFGGKSAVAKVTN
jgi:hypothetical protein